MIQHVLFLFFSQVILHLVQHDMLHHFPAFPILFAHHSDSHTSKYSQDILLSAVPLLYILSSQPVREEKTSVSCQIRFPDVLRLSHILPCFGGVLWWIPNPTRVSVSIEVILASLTFSVNIISWHHFRVQKNHVARHLSAGIETLLNKKIHRCFSTMLPQSKTP